MQTWAEVIQFANHGNPQPDRRVVKTDAEWHGVLTPDQYRVARERDTERAFSSDMCTIFEPGDYACVCCGTVLFDSTTKFESNSGWPSFDQPIEPNVVAYHRDESHGMNRIEATCSTCDAHLGHVFPDGPEPSGLRYCLNALALTKEADDLGA